MAEVDDRIFSTSVELLYTFAPFEIAAPRDEKKLEFCKEQIRGAGGLGAWEGPQVGESARAITLETFAVDESASVQVCAAGPSGVGGTDRDNRRRRCTRWASD